MNSLETYARSTRTKIDDLEDRINKSGDENTKKRLKNQISAQ